MRLDSVGKHYPRFYVFSFFEARFSLETHF